MNVQDLLGKVTQYFSVSRAFGTAYEKGDVLVIPVAMVVGGGGGGDGPVKLDEGASENETNSPIGEKSEGAKGVVSRSGGGFGGVVIPVGVYVAKND